MKPLRNLLDKIKPKVEKNNFLHTTYDAIETFLFKPKWTTKPGEVHIRDGMDLKRTMIHVVLAMQLCLLHGIINIGHQHYVALGMYEGLLQGLPQKALYGLFQLLPIIIVVHVVAIGIEFLFAAIKRHQVEEGILVSAFLIPLIMPPDIPLWMVGLGTAFAVVVAKEAFGGTGMNVLNVALTARVFVFFAYPTHMSGDEVWVAYDYNFLHQLFGSFLVVENAQIVDGWTGATPLGLAATGGWSAVMEHYSVSQMIWGFIPGSVGEMNKVFVILGAGLLIFTGIGSWRIMLSMILGTLFMGIILNLLALNPFMEVPFYYHFIMGSFFFAMAFMATDPVTAAQTDVGKWIYGFMIGAIGMIIRVLNPAYPEGWMLAILFMNVFAPLVDHYVLQANIKRRLSRAS